MAEFIPTGIGGLGSRSTAKKSIDKKAHPLYERQELLPPPRPQRDFIPSPETIEALVRRAISALSKGIYWDRGSIINLVL